MDKKNLKELAVIFGLLIFGAVTLTITDKVFIPAIEDLENWGNYGDFYGGLVGTLVSLIAVFLVYKTYQVQKEELSETKETLTKQNFDSFYFELLRFFRQTKLEIKFFRSDSNLDARYQGDAALIQLRETIFHEYGLFKRNKHEESFFNYIVPKLGSKSNYFSIFHLFFRILDTLKQENLDDSKTKIEKQNYIKTFKALVNNDLLLLITFTVPYIDDDEIRSDYKILLNRNGFIDDLLIPDYLLSHVNEFYKD